MGKYCEIEFTEINKTNRPWGVVFLCKDGRGGLQIIWLDDGCLIHGSDSQSVQLEDTENIPRLNCT